MTTLIDKLKVVASTAGVIGLIYLLYIHINAIDYVDLQGNDKIPSIVGLGKFAIFIVGLALVLYRQKELREQNPNLKQGPKLFFTAVFGDAPYLSILVLTTFLYANYYGFFVMGGYEGITEIIEGKYIFSNHGQVLKQLSESEFLQYRARELKMSTASSMLFYAFGTSASFPRLRKISDN